MFIVIQENPDSDLAMAHELAQRLKAKTSITGKLLNLLHERPLYLLA